MSTGTTWSRREFMVGAGATALAASSASLPVRAATGSEVAPGPEETSRFDQPGKPSRTAERAWAEAEYSHYQMMRGAQAQQGGSPASPNFSRVLDAVKDVGCDPSGNRPISNDIDGSVQQDGTLVVFPPGNYLIEDEWGPNVDGTFGLVGSGYESASTAPVPGSDVATLVSAPNSRAALNLDATTGLIANFVMDMSANESSISILLRSRGFVQARDVRFVGTVDNTGSAVAEAKSHPLCRFVTDPGTTGRAERLVARYVGAPGDKNSGGVPMFWVGEGNEGIAQIGHCISQGASDNGVYGGRTSGDVHIKGGHWINNEVAQLRYSGAGSFADGVTMVVDKDRYQGPASNGGYNETYGTNGVKIERGDNGYNKPGGAILRNSDIQVLSLGSQGIGAPVFVRGSGGALKIDNCRIVNKVEDLFVNVQAPGSGYSSAAAPPPHNITITDSMLVGPNSGTAIRVNGRGNSLMSNTCLKIPGDGPGSVTGMQLGSGNGFGQTCSAGGLSNPDAVGSAGNLSSVNYSASNASGFSQMGMRQSQAAQKGGIIKALVSAVFMVIAAVAALGIGIGGLVLLLGGIGTILVYLIADE